MPKQKEVSTLTGIIIIVAAIIIFFGGAFAYQYFATKSQQNSEFFASSQKTTQSQQATSGWKTYTNTKFNYQIEYPTGGLIDPSSDGRCISISTTSGNFLINYNSANVPCGVTGVGDGQIPVSYTLTINGKNYKANGFNNPDNSPSFVNFDFINGIYITVLNSNNVNFIEQVLSTFKFTTPSKQTELKLWPDVNSFDLVNKTFVAGNRNSTSSDNIKVYTNSSTKISSKDMSTSINDFQGIYSMMKNWVGPEWFFTIKGVMQPDGSIVASEISIAGQ